MRRELQKVKAKGHESCVGEIERVPETKASEKRCELIPEKILPE